MTNRPRSRDPLQFLAVRSAILATAWLLVTINLLPHYPVKLEMLSVQLYDI